MPAVRGMLVGVVFQHWEAMFGAQSMLGDVVLGTLDFREAMLRSQSMLGNVVLGF